MQSSKSGDVVMAASNMAMVVELDDRYGRIGIPSVAAAAEAVRSKPEIRTQLPLAYQRFSD